MRHDNSIVVDLGKVTFAQFYYYSLGLGLAHRRHSIPKKPTVNGIEFDPSAIRTGSETMLQYAQRRGLLDKWEPTLFLQLSNSHSLRYTGEKAISIWNEWKRRIFKPTNTKQ